MTTWQDIATAPKTSNHILLFGDGHAIIECSVVASWDEEAEHWRIIGGEYFPWPTHWMSLPEPPK